MKGDYIVNNKDQCTQFTVIKRWAVVNFVNQVAVKISNITDGFASYLKTTSIMCHLDGLDMKGTIVGKDRINCEQTRFTQSVIAKNAKTMLYNFYVEFDRKRIRFDDDANYYFHVYVRDCGADHEEQRDDCVTCLWNDPEENRHYLRKCSSRDPCIGAYEVYDRRNVDGVSPISNLTDNEVRLKCANAMVSWFEPRYGLRTGGTSLKIAVRGHRILAENATAIVVTVAGRDCADPVTFPDEEMVACTTTGHGPDTGPVRVSYVRRSSTTLTVESADAFEFVEPRVTGTSPSCGPVGGGTLLNLTGEYLDAAAVGAAHVRLSTDRNGTDGYGTCARIAIGRRGILCVTGAGREPGPVAIALVFDEGHRYPVRDAFTYAGDPVLDAGQTFGGIASGGTAVPVRGKHFSCVKSVTLCVDRDGARHCAARGCESRNDTYMVCRSPWLVGVTASTTLRFGLRTEFADHTLDLSPGPDRSTYHLYPDPVYDDFEMDNRLVTINGRGLDSGCRAADVAVWLLWLDGGRDNCSVMLMTESRIVCEIAVTPSTALAARNDAVVRVTVGDTLVYDVREKSGFALESSATTALSVIVFAVVIAIVFVVVVVAVALCRFGTKRRNVLGGDYNENESNFRESIPELRSFADT